jgi:hypothetical protein
MSVENFACQNCGEPYQAYPPDSTFKKALLKPCENNEGDPNHNRKQFYECKNCDHKNELYWCPGHIFFSST